MGFLRSKFYEFVHTCIVQRQGHLRICPIGAYQWATNLSNLITVGPRFAVRMVRISVYTCSCATSGSFAVQPLYVGVFMGEKLNLWNH